MAFLEVFNGSGGGGDHTHFLNSHSKRGGGGREDGENLAAIKTGGLWVGDFEQKAFPRSTTGTNSYAAKSRPFTDTESL